VNLNNNLKTSAVSQNQEPKVVEANVQEEEAVPEEIDVNEFR